MSAASSSKSSARLSSGPCSLSGSVRSMGPTRMLNPIGISSLVS
eukprot:CAMPEP_0119563290 /NCGR_PEP_ID=MMETSP1352-20130426/22927_1 /TAXON_ID=265584 /ORGANISM="Stauroneis constricta, Strain CCMP1120" /LENGTH=43 /DNA_ID= /DNA_START= /DNA_END= /DNA_ORIENTATION=